MIDPHDDRPSRVSPRNPDEQRDIEAKHGPEYLEFLGTIERVLETQARTRNDRYFQYSDLSGRERAFDLAEARLILEGVEGSNRGELLILTETGSWVLLDAPAPGGDPPLPPRPAIEIDRGDAAWWCMSGRYSATDSAGRPIPDEHGRPVSDMTGLPVGLQPVVAGTGRIDAWRRGDYPADDAGGDGARSRDGDRGAAPPADAAQHEAPASDGGGRDEAAVTDPLETTVKSLGRAVGQANLVRFLAKQPGHKATIDEVVTGYLGRRFPTKRDRRHARRRAEVTRENLEARGCPLRLAIGGNIVRLIDA